MKKILYLFGVLLLLISCNSVSAQTWAWAKSINGYDYIEEDRITQDNASNIIVCGDIFFSKYDTAGNLLWLKDTSNGFGGCALGVCTDAANNIYLTGYFFDSVYFGPTLLRAAGIGDIFIAKYDPLGNVIWAKSVGGSSDERSYDIACDAVGNLYITGFFGSTNLSFGTIPVSGSGGVSFFLAKYDSSGNSIWVKTESNGDYCKARSLCVDKTDNIFITGYYETNTMPFGSFTVTGSGSYNAFLVKYDSSGNVLWAKGTDGDGYDESYGVTTDSHGNSYISGEYSGNFISFDGTTLSGLSTDESLFVVSYDIHGNLRWAKNATCNGNNYAEAVRSDGSDGIYITGGFADSTLSFGAYQLLNKGGTDVFIAKFDTTGNPKWAVANGGEKNDGGEGLALGKTGYLYIVGAYKSPTLQFGTTTLTSTDTSLFFFDVFVAKLKIDALYSPLLPYQQSSVDLYPNPGNFRICISSPYIISAINVEDVTGKILSQNECNTTKLEIDISSLPSGIYTVIINNEVVRKFVKR